MTRLNLEQVQTLLINGIGGGVGIAAAQIARDLGINVIGTASEDKRGLVETLGATLIASGDGVSDRVKQILPPASMRTSTWPASMRSTTWPAARRYGRWPN